MSLVKGRRLNPLHLALTVGVPLIGTGLVSGCYDIQPLPESIELSVDKLGVVSAEDLGVSGQWYVYGDNYGELKSCTEVGYHKEEACSYVTYPAAALPELKFPNQGGKMCVAGVAAQVLECCKPDPSKDEDKDSGNANLCEEGMVNTVNCGTKETFDDSSMWGAGMGFDLTLEVPDAKEDGMRKRDSSMIAGRTPWDAAKYGVRGISFDLEWHADKDSPPPIRVNFPMMINEDVQLPDGRGTVGLKEDGTPDIDNPIQGGELMPAPFSTEQHPYGSPFWQKDPTPGDWNPSPIKQGTNTILWEDVFPPPEEKDNYLKKDEFKGQQLLGIQFQVATDHNYHVPFSFCVSNVKFLLE